MNTISNWLDDFWFAFKHRAKFSWLIVSRRPFLTCPLCKGEGGELSGYCEREWCECDCYRYWDEVADYGGTWFVGRLPLIAWLRAKVSLRIGLWYFARWRTIFRCGLGIHDFEPHDDWEPGLKICRACCEHRTKGTP